MIKGTLLTAILVIAATLTACSGPPEEPLLRQYFHASQLRDNHTLARFATVSFNPKTDGTVSSFTVIKVSEARNQLSDARSVAELSLMNSAGGTSVDLTKTEGDLVTKEATIDAEVNLPDGSVVKKTLVITIQQARVKNDKPEGLVGRWVITAIKDAGKAPDGADGRVLTPSRASRTSPAGFSFPHRIGRPASDRLPAPRR